MMKRLVYYGRLATLVVTAVNGLIVVGNYKSVKKIKKQEEEINDMIKEQNQYLATLAIVKAEKAEELSKNEES